MIRVLIADSSTAMRNVVKRTFSQAFPVETFEFDEVTDGDELYDKAAAGGSWAVITAERDLPAMTGADVLRKLKTADRWKNLPPFVFVTSECTAEIKAEALEAGASSFIFRPFMPETFKAIFGPIFAKNAGAS